MRKARRLKKAASRGHIPMEVTASISTTLVLFATLSTIGSDHRDDIRRTELAAQVFKEIMDTPEYSSRAAKVGEMYRHYSREREVCIFIRR